MGDRTVAVSLMLKVGQYVASAGQAAASTKQIIDEVENLGKTSESQFNDIVAAVAAGGVALSGMAGYAVNAAMEFDKQMSEVSAVSNATGKDLQSLRAAALQAGKDTQYSATEAAKAEAELAKAGIQTSDIMGGALSGSLALAAAGQMDLADAATIAAQTMNIFELKGQNVTHIADVLASAANTSAADMHDLGLGLQQVGLVAHQAGFSLEETTGMLAAFADRGLEGSDGATSLKTAIQRLTAPVDQAKTLMDSLGISVYDANGKVKSAADLAGILQKQLGGLSVEQRNAAMNTIFGSDAIRAASVLYNLGADGVKKYTAAVDQNGAAARTAGEKTDNLSGDLERLRGSIETVAIQAGSGANGGLRTLAQSADGLVNAFGALPGPVQTSLTVIAGVGGAGMLATAGLLKVRQTAQEAATALTAMGPAGARAVTALGTVGSVVGKLGLAGLAVGGMVLGLNALFDWADKKHAPVKANIDDLTDSMKQFADSGRVAGELASKYGDSLQKIGRDADDVTKGMADLAEMNRLVREGLSAPEAMQGWEPVNPQQVQRIKDLDTALSGLVKNGGATQAKLFLDQLMTSGKLTTDQFVALTGMLPQYAAATDAAGLSSSGLAKGFGDVETNARTLAGSLQEAMHAGQSLKDVFDQLNGAQINLTQAQINAEAAVDKLSEALKEGGGSLDLNTEKGRAAAQASVDLAQKGRDLAQATFEQTHNAEQARGVFEQYRQQLINNIATAGGTTNATNASRQAAELLASQIMQMPAFKKIDISTPGLDTAINRVGTLSQYIAGLKDKTVNITTISSFYGDNNLQQGKNARFAVPNANRWGGLYTHAAVGALRDANIYSAVSSGARYGYAERETGGEFFGPKYGNLSRTRAMATHAVENWWGGHVTWGDDSAPAMRANRSAPMMRGNVGGGGVTNITTVTIPVNAGMGTNGQQVGQQIAEALRPFVQRNGGGSVQVAIMGRQVA